jgi:hypothetical protein
MGAFVLGGYCDAEGSGIFDGGSFGGIVQFKRSGPTGRTR